MDVQGLVVVGEFLGDTEKVYGRNHEKAGQPVPGMREVRVLERGPGGREFTHRLTYFATERDGYPTMFARSIERAEPQPGDRVAVQVTARASGEWVNLNPVQIVVLDRDAAGPSLEAVG